METSRGLNTKTAMEHLIFLTGQNIIEVCRTFGITPQQFSDWIKQRRPIPADRLKQLATHFGVPEDTLADERRFARRISALSAVELEQMIVAKRLKTSTTAEEASELADREKQLEAERHRQRRIARLAVLLEKDDPSMMALVDRFLDDMERQQGKE